MAVKKRRKRKKGNVKFYIFEGLKCQGKKELRFLKECVRYKKPLPTKPKRIKTPYGFYTPDFEFPDKYIEIKCLGTFLVCLGKIGYRKGKVSDLQFRKIKWVAKNIKPLWMIVYLSNNEYKPQENLEFTNLTIKFKGGKSKKNNI